MEKLFSAEFFLLVLLFVGGVQLCFCSNSAFGCIDGERQALLKLKQSFNDDSSRFSSWTGKDCCKWKRVSCSRSTGHVLKLDLSSLVYLLDDFVSGEYSYKVFNFSEQLSTPQLNSCLMELKHLEYLDLSGNEFQQSRIPKFLGSMKHLRYLNLSHARFRGRIPDQLGNLSHLQTLDLSYQDNDSINSSGLYADNFQWVSSLSSLRHLDMTYVDLTKALDLIQVLSTLPSLLHLSLDNCGIQNIHFPRSPLNSTFPASIQFLSLAVNMLTGSLDSIPNAPQNMTATFNSYNTTVPFWLGNLKSLVYLNLAMNDFDHIEGGLLSMLNNACSLKSLHLSSNRFRGELLETKMNSSRCLVHDLEFLDLSNNGIGGGMEDWLGQLKGLKYLNLDANSLHGPIPSSLGQLSVLRELFLSHNQLNGTIPRSLGRLSALEKLILSNNQLNGIIPQSLGGLSNLKQLDLSYNQLTGSLPYNLGQLVNLEILDVSSNGLEGIVSEVHFSKLSSLNKLIISANNLACKFKPDWIPPFSSLEVLNMSSCEIGSKFPQWLKTLYIEELDLSNASISGDFPLWQSTFFYLDLSMNQISGNLPTSIVGNMSDLRTLLLSNNMINGSIPDFLCKLENLMVLDLSRNRLIGEVPNCWRDANQEVFLINLSSNRLSGTIPSSFGQFSQLRWLHLNNNSLSGELPSSLSNCRLLELMDLGENNFSGIIPPWIGDNMWSLRILRLRNNMLIGNIPSQLCQLNDLQIMDLAGNSLTGGIPRCFGMLTGMTTTKNNVAQEYMVLSPGPISTEEPAPGPVLGSISTEEPTLAPVLGPISAGEPMATSIIDNYDELRNGEKVRESTKGLDLEYTKMQLQLIDIMDLSRNMLDGVIPVELCRLSGLRGLNLSHNHLSGNIPNEIGELSLLESLDLSDNKLVGSIPPSMSNIASLSHLDLSHNNLSGKIPEGNQLQTLNDPSIYADNLQLCGDPLPEKCPRDDEQVQPPMSTGNEDEDDEENKLEKIWFYFVIFSGYATGLWAVIGTLFFKRDWRLAYFSFADEAKERIIVMVVEELERLKRMMERPARTE